MSVEANIENRLTKVEIKIDSLEEKVDDLSDIKDVVVRLALLSEQQVEHNKKFAETHEKLMDLNTEFSSTLKAVNCNLNNINTEIKDTNKKMLEIENKVCDLSNNSKIDILDLGKKAIIPLISGGIIFYILQVVGIIKF